MSGGGGGGSTNTIQKADPWKKVQPYLEELFPVARQWFEGPNPQYYPESTVAGQAPETLASQYLATQRALAGSPLQAGAQQLGYNTMAGNFLGSNPYLNSMFQSATDPLVDQFSRAIAPSITSQFALGGRYGSGAHQGAITDAAGKLGQALGTMGAQIYGPAYESERARQQQMVSMAPQLAAMDYTDLAQLAQIGGLREQRAQDLLNAEIARWDYQQNLPWNKIQQYNNLLMGGAGLGSTTSSRTQAPSQGGFNPAGAIGGMAAATSLAPSLFSGVAPAFHLAGGSTGALGSGLSAGLGAIGPWGWGALAAGALLGSGLF